MLMTTERLDLNAMLLASRLEPDINLLIEEPHLVVVTEPQQEVRATVTLQSFRVPYYLPMITHLTTRGVRRTKVKSYRPLLRGYIMIPESACQRFVSLHQRRPMPIHGFLRCGENFSVVTEIEIRRLRNIEQELAKPKSIQSIWSVGEVARIGDGAFTGLNCAVTDLANGQRITVEVSLLGRSVPITLDEASLAKL
jgi:transcription antitermination factor NusG